MPPAPWLFPIDRFLTPFRLPLNYNNVSASFKQYAPDFIYRIKYKNDIYNINAGDIRESETKNDFIIPYIEKTNFEIHLKHMISLLLTSKNLPNAILINVILNIRENETTGEKTIYAKNDTPVDFEQIKVNSFERYGPTSIICKCTIPFESFTDIVSIGQLAALIVINACKPSNNFLKQIPITNLSYLTSVIRASIIFIDCALLSFSSPINQFKQSQSKKYTGKCNSPKMFTTKRVKTEVNHVDYVRKPNMSASSKSGFPDLDEYKDDDENQSGNNKFDLEDFIAGNDKSLSTTDLIGSFKNMFTNDKSKSKQSNIFGKFGTDKSQKSFLISYSGNPIQPWKYSFTTNLTNIQENPKTSKIINTSNISEEQVVESKNKNDQADTNSVLNIEEKEDLQNAKGTLSEPLVYDYQNSDNDENNYIFDRKDIIDKRLNAEHISDPEREESNNIEGTSDYFTQTDKNKKYGLKDKNSLDVAKSHEERFYENYNCYVKNTIQLIDNIEDNREKKFESLKLILCTNSFFNSHYENEQSSENIPQEISAKMEENRILNRTNHEYNNFSIASIYLLSPSPSPLTKSNNSLSNKSISPSASQTENPKIQKQNLLSKNNREKNISIKVTPFHEIYQAITTHRDAILEYQQSGNLAPETLKSLSKYFECGSTTDTDSRNIHTSVHKLGFIPNIYSKLETDCTLNPIFWSSGHIKNIRLLSIAPFLRHTSSLLLPIQVLTKLICYNPSITISAYTLAAVCLNLVMESASLSFFKLPSIFPKSLIAEMNETIMPSIVLKNSSYTIKQEIIKQSKKNAITVFGKVSRKLFECELLFGCCFTNDMKAKTRFQSLQHPCYVPVNSTVSKAKKWWVKYQNTMHKIVPIRDHTYDFMYGNNIKGTEGFIEWGDFTKEVSKPDEIEAQDKKDYEEFEKAVRKASKNSTKEKNKANQVGPVVINGKMRISKEIYGLLFEGSGFMPLTFLDPCSSKFILAVEAWARSLKMFLDDGYLIIFKEKGLNGISTCSNIKEVSRSIVGQLYSELQKESRLIVPEFNGSLQQITNVGIVENLKYMRELLVSRHQQNLINNNETDNQEIPTLLYDMIQ